MTKPPRRGLDGRILGVVFFLVLEVFASVGWRKDGDRMDFNRRIFSFFLFLFIPLNLRFNLKFERNEKKILFNSESELEKEREREKEEGVLFRRLNSALESEKERKE